MAKKIIKVKAAIDRSGGNTSYTYPEGYHSDKIQVLAYGEPTKEGEQEYAHCIGVVDDKDFAEFTKTDAINEISQEDAVTAGAEWRPQVEKTLDQDAVNAILVKVAKDEALTAEDKKVLDPDDPTPGLNKSQSFEELLTKHL